jgi:hypothetical protein
MQVFFVLQQFVITAENDKLVGEEYQQEQIASCIILVLSKKRWANR